MPAITVVCPNCRSRSRADLPEGQTRVSCPACGAGLRLKTSDPLPTPSEEEGASESATRARPDEGDTARSKKAKPERKRKKGGPPVWAWAVLGGVLLAGGGLVAAAVLLQRPKTPEAAKPGSEEPVEQPRFQPGAVPAGNHNRTPPRVADAKLGVVGESPVPVPGSRAAAPAALSDVIYLLPDDTPAQRGAIAPSIFDRELIRQALWLAAHEEFGLRVPDASLGEPVPDGLPADRQFRLREAMQGLNRWTLTVRQAGADHQIWAGAFLDQGSGVERFADWIARAESLSREFDRLCLEAAGFKPRPGRLSDAPVPPAVEEHLGQMQELDQLIAIRLLHAEVREKGESEALLAALARGYATLGMLTEFHWGTAPMAFKARGLLYAQRLVARSPKSPSAIWTRAYAAALAGAHRMALADLEAAAKLAQGGTPATPPPAWVEPVDAYLHFDPARLAAARKKADTPLVRLLQFLAVEEPLTPAVTINAGRELLQADPECYRVHESMCRVGGVAHLHSATVVGPAVFSERLVKRVRALPGLPAPVAGLLEGQAHEAELYEALRAAGAPAADRGEPSWAAFGSVLQEVRFAQTFHRLDFMARMWSVPTRDTALAAAEALRGHPLLPVIESFGAEPARDPAAVRRNLLSAPSRDFGLKGSGYYHRLRQVDAMAADAWFLSSAMQTENLYPNDAHKTRSHQPDYVKRTRMGGALQKLSPFSPLARALAMAEGGPEVGPELANLERQYAAHAIVMKVLGERHLADRRFPDAVRCWERWVELSPDRTAYQQLAEAWLANGKEDRWRETLEASLKTEDHGLGHAHVRVTLARHFMAKKDYRKALPYAQAAAESGAGWALQCAAECEQALRHWGSADDYYRTAVERYEDSSILAFGWYFACRATGKMDRAAAEKAVRDFLARTSGSLKPEEFFFAARFYLLTGDLRTALARFNQVNPALRDGTTELLTALTADALGDERARDQALAGVEKLPPTDALKPVGEIIRGWTALKTPPDAETVEAALGKLGKDARVDADFFVGWYLYTRGQKDRAGKHWERCKSSDDGTRILKTHAQAGLELLAKKEPSPGE